MGVKKLFLVIEKFAFVKSLLFMSTLRKKKVWAIFPISLYQGALLVPHFLGVQSTTKNNAKFEIVHLVFFAIP